MFDDSSQVLNSLVLQLQDYNPSFDEAFFPSDILLVLRSHAPHDILGVLLDSAYFTTLHHAFPKLLLVEFLWA